MTLCDGHKNQQNSINFSLNKIYRHLKSKKSENAPLRLRQCQFKVQKVQRLSKNLLLRKNETRQEYFTSFALKLSLKTEQS